MNTAPIGARSGVRSPGYPMLAASGSGTPTREEDHVPAGDGGQPDLTVELCGQQLRLFDRGRDRAVLLQRGESRRHERRPQGVGTMHRIADDEAVIAEHRERRVRRRQVHAEVLDQLADGESADGCAVRNDTIPATRSAAGAGRASGPG